MSATPDDLQQTIAELREQLMERTDELNETLAQQAATAEVLQIINSSAGDVAPVFDAMLEKAMRLCDTTFGNLMTWDGERFHRIAFRGVPEQLIEEMRQPMRPAAGSFADLLVQGKNLICDADLQEAEAGSVGPGAESLRRFGVRARAMVALRKDEKLLGAISVYRMEARPFTDKQIALLQNFAAQAVIAMENARLITETREALEQQTATAEVLGVINSSPGDLAPVFDAILEKAMRLCEAAFGGLWIFGDRYVATALRGVPQAYAEFLRGSTEFPGPGTAAYQFFHGERSVIHNLDLANEEAYLTGQPLRVALVDLGGARTAVQVPLLKDGGALGLMTIYRQEVRPFTDKQIALLQNFAAQAVIAMENARLLTETREALEQETATAEVLQVINASPGDLKPVFSSMLEKALRLCGADLGNLLTYDGDCFEAAVGVYGLTSVGERELQRGLFRPEPGGGLLDRLVLGEDLIHTEIVRTAVAYQRNREFRALVDEGGYQSTTHVALRKESQLRGAIVIFFKEQRTLTEKQITLLRDFAQQAVIAMENARLLGELRQRNDEIAGWNKELEDRVAAQLGELERVGKLKRFLAPQLAELIVARGDEAVLKTHRRDIVVVFCDLRDFTTFAETAEPEEVLDLLREYHAALGPIVSASEGTLDHFSGDGIMVFFNDPVPVADASERAVRMATQMRAAMAELQQQWRRQGRRIGFGAGIARGYATLGQIGFADRIDYTAIGTVCNLAARLCAEAKDGQILLSQRVAAAVEETMPLDEIGELALKGLREPVAVYNVRPAIAEPAFRVIEGGSPSD